MNVKVNQSSSQKTNPQNQIKTNPQNQPPQNLNPQSNQDQINEITTLLQQLLQKVSINRQQIEQLLQINHQNQIKTNPQGNILQQNEEFIVKASMKASVIALKVENLLLLKKKIIMSGLGYATPILLDSVMLIKKDLEKQQKYVKIDNIEIFEKTVEAIKGNKKIVSGLKITLSI